MSEGRPVTPVSIVAARLDALLRRADDSGIDPVLVEDLRAVRDLAVGLDPYVGACTTPESDDLAALSRRTREVDWVGGGTALEQEMLSGHVEGRLLAFLVHLARARRVLEVGMFTGYSALAMAEALPDDGWLVACELDPRAAAVAQEAFDASPHGDKIAVRIGDARDQLDALAGEGATFDLVFVDADKAGYAGYLDQLLDGGLLAEGGVVCVDNTLMQGHPWTHEHSDAGSAIAAFNTRVAEDPRVEQVLVPVRDGLTLIRRV